MTNAELADALHVSIDEAKALYQKFGTLQAEECESTVDTRMK